jgi:hypothetical protein
MARAGRPNRTGNFFVEIDNVEPTKLLMAKYGRSFENDVRDNVRDNVSPFVAKVVAASFAGGDKQARAVARTVKSTRDRFPAIKAFGSTRVTSGGIAAGAIGFGANFGGGNRFGTVHGRSKLGKTFIYQRRVTRQFGSYQPAPEDHHIYRTFSHNTVKINELWQQALDDVYVAWHLGKAS